MKRVIFGSVVTAALVFTGCGGGSSDDTKSGNGGNGGNGGSTPDTTAPVFASSTLRMTTSGTATLVATDASMPITYALTSGTGFELNASKLSTSNAEGEYNITVTATDSASTPNTATQNFVVTVSNAPVTVTVAGYEWTALRNYDDNQTLSGKVAWETARTECANLGSGWSLPSSALLEGNTSAPSPTSTIIPALVGDSDWNYNAAVATNGQGTALTIWTDDNSTSGYGIVKANTNSYPTTDISEGSFNFYTCHKAVN